jgi:hypothetical protein
MKIDLLAAAVHLHDILSDEQRDHDSYKNQGKDVLKKAN